MKIGKEAYKPQEFSLALPPSMFPIQFIDKKVEAIDRMHPRVIKVAYYALWAMTFFCGGFAIASRQMKDVFCLTALTLVFLPLSLAVQKVYERRLNREFYLQLSRLLKLEEIPEPLLKKGKLKNLTAEHIPGNVIKGMDCQSRPFLAFKTKEGFTCFYREGIVWRKFSQRGAQQIVTIKEFKAVIAGFDGRV